VIKNMALDVWIIVLVSLAVLAIIFFLSYQVRILRKKNKRLEIQVAERTSDLKERGSEHYKTQKITDKILNNVQEGLFLINEKFEIEVKYSDALEKILGDKELAAKDIFKLLANKLIKIPIKEVRQYLTFMFADSIDEETLITLNPLSDVTLKVDNTYKEVQFRFKRVSYRGKTVDLLCTLNDITEQKKLKKNLEESRSQVKKQMEWMLGLLHVDPALLQDFLESVRIELKMVEETLRHGEKSADYQAVLEKVFRSMHLIKGNASLLDLKIFSKQAHKFEEEVVILKNKTDLGGRDFVQLVLQLNELKNTLGEVSNLIERIGKIHKHLRPKRNYENKLLIQSLQNLVDMLANELGKEVIFIYDNFDAGEIPYNYKLIVKEIITQLIRNSVYHGIESSQERSKVGKLPYGTIEIETFVNGEQFGFKFKDDGRGIQIDKLRQIAIASGKWSKQEVGKWDTKRVAHTIFVPGITTLDSANIVAGRGVGMDLIKEKIIELNGKIELDYAENKYCEFRITIPLNGVNLDN
jgi:two-component system chemotaxis sensor kinase CheA